MVLQDSSEVAFPENDSHSEDLLFDKELSSSKNLADFSHIHSQRASWIASISEWFDDVATIVCFINLYEIAVPL